MRNLKKFLALVMAMVMALSLMVSANAATTNVAFKDSDQVDPAFAEAVTILSGMGIYKGDENGFRPGSSITRGEVAAVIYRLATGDVSDNRTGLYTVYSPFTDVAESDWFAGYVGYLWDAQIIKGTTATTYNPYDEVTGYEVLAMILRAIGYDKDHEFEGAQWIVNVSALATELGILKDVKTTHYGDTLYLASRRDVVASLLFRAANDVATVNYTPIAGYNKYTALTSTNLNPTLGWKNFGLTEDLGIVVGNQETGETNTRLSITNDRVLPYGDPIYSYVELQYGRDTNTLALTTNMVAATAPTTWASRTTNLNWIATFNWDTGLEQFAHQMNVWFDGRNTYKGLSADNQAFDDNNIKTYAMFDRSTNTALVKLGKNDAGSAFDNNAYKVNSDLDTPAAGGDTLMTLAKKAGFTVGSTTTAYMNQAFDRFLPDVDDKFDGTGKAGTDNVAETLAPKGEYNAKLQAGITTPANQELKAPEALYLMISNSADKALDVVIGLNIQISEITGIDNVNTIKTVSVPYVMKGETAGYLEDNGTTWDYIDDQNRLTATMQGDDISTGTLEQKQLVMGSAMELGDYEIGLRVEGTATQGGTGRVTTSGTSSGLLAGIGTNGYETERKVDGTGAAATFDSGRFFLKPITNTVEGKVMGYNTTTNSVTLDNGKTYEASILYHTVVPDTLPQQTSYDNGTYILYLDDDGDLLGAEHTYGSTFLYGTYVDYETKVASSTFDYTMVYVGLDGKYDTATVSKLTRNDTTVTARPKTDNITGNDILGVPYRDTQNATVSGTGSTNGIGVGQYRGFVYDDKTVDWTFASLANRGIIAGANIDPPTGATNEQDSPLYDDECPEVEFNGKSSLVGGGTNASIVIDSDAVGLGAAFAGSLDMDGTNASGTNPADELYFTGDTTFILVSGYGTDSVKAEVFNGIKDLKGDSEKVYINLHYAVGNSKSDDNKDGAPGSSTVRLANVKSGILMSDMTYFTQEPFLYAQNRVLSRQAKVIILPAAAVSRTSSSDTYYVGNSEPTLVNAYGKDATQFTMYQKGEAKKIWVKGVFDPAYSNGNMTYTQNTPTLKGTNDATALIATGDDHFYKLTATTDKANDGGTIYEIELTNCQWTQNEYLASTYSAQTGSFTWNTNVADTSKTEHTSSGTVMKNVNDAKILNLNALNKGSNVKWAGITDLTTLNQAGSLGVYGATNQYGGYQKLYVSVIADGLNISELYVCYDQTPANYPAP